MKTIAAISLLLCAAAVTAQTVQDKKPAQPAAAAAPAGAAEQPKAKPKPAQKQADPDEEGTVMIDSGRSEAEDTPRYVQPGERAEDVPGGIPSSLGQCKGVINDAGRTILVFESLDDGAISFVQITFGKGGISWKLLDKVGRSQD